MADPVFTEVPRYTLQDGQAIVIRCLSIGPDRVRVEIHFKTTSGRVFRVEHDLSAENWITICDNQPEFSMELAE